MPPLTRRRWLLDALILAGFPRALAATEPGEELVDFADCEDFRVEVQERNPRVKCFDLRRLTAPITPPSEFFVFHQTDVPRIDVRAWRLDIGGFVERPASFTMPQLMGSDLPTQEVDFTLECSGNLPRPHIMNGQVSTARWSGFSLASVLRQCGLKSEAREVVFFGADRAREPAGEAVAPHGRSIFVQDAMNPHAILATTMNGQPLPPEHGFPLRLILPGWYGVAQIKWLTRIEVLDRRYEGPHMSRNYHTLHAASSRPDAPFLLETSISRTRLKSVVARVTRRQRGTGRSFRIAGAAWGGGRRIERVEVRVDDGPWRAAHIDERRGEHAWLLWSLDWTDATPGRHTLVSRAIDAAGHTQPPLDQWLGAIKSARENNAQWERTIDLPA